jgi:outer membrane protein TolC
MSLVPVSSVLVALVSQGQGPARASDDSLPPVRRLSLVEFVNSVEQLNPSLIAERLAVPIAVAQLSVARLRPNPVLSGGYSGDATGQSLPASYNLGLTQTLTLGGKRGARIDGARSSVAMANAQVEDAVRTLRGAAAQAYFNALLAEQAYERKRQTAEDLDRLVTLNRRRLAAGDIGEIDLLQSEIEALQFSGQLLAAEGDVEAARYAMAAFLTPQRLDTLLAPARGPEVAITTLDRDTLVARAVGHRPDVVAARRQLDVTLAGINAARANRWFDLDVSAGIAFTSASTNQIAPSPAFRALSFGVSLPLMLSTIESRGELEAARLTGQQARQAVIAVEWRAEVDVRQAYARAVNAARQLALYGSQVLQNAGRVRSAKVFSYQRGGATLLDVLAAQRAENDVYLASFDAAANYHTSLVALAEAVGDWGLVFGR